MESKEIKKNGKKSEITYDEDSVSSSKVADFSDIKKKKEKQEKKEHFRENVEKLKSKKFIAIASFAILVIMFSIFISMTIVKNIEIEEGKHYSKNEVKSMIFESIFDYNSVFVYLKHRYTEQGNIPFVEYIDVEWIDRNTIGLRVYDKNIIGCSNFMNEYVYFDKDGYVVETSHKKEKDILYITGINFDQLTLNRKIDVEDEEIFEVILNMTQQIQKYELDITELNFDKNQNLTLYSDKITILLGKQETYDEQLAKLKSMLKEAKTENLSGVLHMENYKDGQERIIFDKNN